MTREALEIIKNFNNELDFPLDLIGSLTDDDIKDNECFGYDIDTAMCVYIVEISNKIYYVASGYEWTNVTDDQTYIVFWWDSYNDENPNKEEIEKERERLKEWLKNYEEKTNCEIDIVFEK